MNSLYDCIIYIRSGYRQDFHVNFFFYEYIDPIRIGRAVNSALPRDVYLSFDSASKFIDRDEGDCKGRQVRSKTMCEK